jgi:hypothetical protein
VFHDNGEDKNITAQRMKSLVGTFCAGKFSFGGVPFNPADHVHYPFNHALLMYDSDESQEHPLDA